MFNKIVANTLPHLPKKIVWMFSKRYVAGERIEDGLEISKALNDRKFMITADLLGEFIHSIEEAEQNMKEYIEMVKRFTVEKIDGNYSIKPTSFGLLINPKMCYQFVREVVKEAAKTNNFVRVDMEDSSCTSQEIELYLKLKKEFPSNVGLVLQAYLKRTYDDVEQMIKVAHSLNEPLNIRLCKGIYIEPEDIAYVEYRQVQQNYLKILELLFENGIHVGIATHDSFLVKEALAMIERYQVPATNYEFQMLFGVTPSLRDSIVAKGHKMRIYVPYGKDWFGYCSRRIKENPKMVSDIVKAVFIRG
jgi:proline dehydrogenase